VGGPSGAPESDSRVGWGGGRRDPPLAEGSWGRSVRAEPTNKKVVGGGEKRTLGPARGVTLWRFVRGGCGGVAPLLARLLRPAYMESGAN